MRPVKYRAQSRYRRRRRLTRLVFLLLVAAMLVFAAVTIRAAFFATPASVPSEDVSAGIPPDGANTGDSGDSSAPAAPPDSGSDSRLPADGEAAAADLPAFSPGEAGDADPDAEGYRMPGADVALPARDAVDESYFDDAVFIGNSRTEGFALYSGLPHVTAYANRGLTVGSFFTDPVVSLGGKKVTAAEALRRNPDFKKVYIMLGTNELGWAYSSIFIEKYASIVDLVREINPDAVIYLQSVLPVSQMKSEEGKAENRERIAEFNELISAMAVEKEVCYLNVAEAVADENGYLPAEASTDGVHLKKDYCEKWLSYLKTHTAAQ